MYVKEEFLMVLKSVVYMFEYILLVYILFWNNGCMDRWMDGWIYDINFDLSNILLFKYIIVYIYIIR